MKTSRIHFKLLLSLGLFILLETAASAGGPAITIYNKDFAVVRVDLPLDLKKGVQLVNYDGATAHIETDSVVLRDPSGKSNFEILEQNYDANVMSQALLLSLNEGRSIDFLIGDVKGTRTVPGKIVRSGQNEPIIEMEGKLRFGLPGIPLFPPLGNGALLKPTLTWKIETPTAAKINAELAYLTGGMSWEASYNLVAPEKSNEVDLIGWITMENQTGRDFDDAKIKLMAGDVSKIQQAAPMMKSRMYAMDMVAKESKVSEKSFDEFHLYTLSRPVTFKDRETKQVEFIHAARVQSEAIYLYDGAATQYEQYQNWDPVSLRQDQNLGTVSQPKVWAMREFKNAKTNQLGIPLPKGKLRFYRRDDDGRLEFTGENVIDHTPKDETVRVYTGNAFDLVGERKRTNYKIDANGGWLDESFEITLKNHKETDVEIRVQEKLYRWVNWKISAKSTPFQKTSSQGIEFRVKVPKNASNTVTYTAHYSW